ncbi:MAG: hypothetical protein EXQ86_07800 [Rhodospirillales bacterium]|nr:hypothetical protein [Rhodospirillales bacterium]
MMREVSAALFGALRLAQLDPGGLRFFNVSSAGFRRSFFAAVLVAPLYAILLFVRYLMGLEAASVPRYIAIEGIAYVIAWVAFPVAMDPISRLLGRSDRYVPYIVAYNWAQVWQNALYMPLAVFGITGAIPGPVYSVLNVAALTLIMFYGWFIARTAFQVPAATAAGLVVFDFLLSLFITGFADRLL